MVIGGEPHDVVAPLMDKAVVLAETDWERRQALARKARTSRHD